MSNFKVIFGIDKDEVKKNCVLLPLLTKNILNNFSGLEFLRGKLYACAQEKNFTVIHTGLGPTLLGDAVLYLADTQAENVILFGSCGLVKETDDLSIASLVVPRKAFNKESFSHTLLEDDCSSKASYPDKGLLEKLAQIKNCGIKKVDCATVGSLKLEEERIEDFVEKRIEVVDMECSAFFNACRYIKRRAAALLYVTDILKVRPFYKKLDTKIKSTLSSSINHGVNILCKLIETLD